MKKIYLIVFSFLLQGCLSEEIPAEPIIIDPPMYISIGRDSLITGEFIGLNHEEAYRKLQEVEKLEYLNVVGNGVEKFEELTYRLPLYSYFVFDYQPGSDKGVQIWMEEGKVKSIFLNSGRELGQWPEWEREGVRVGESREAAAEKLANLQRRSKYAANFAHTLLAVKDMQEGYDRHLDSTPEWYYTKVISAGRMDVYHLRFKGDVLDHILVNKMKK